MHNRGDDKKVPRFADALAVLVLILLAFARLVWDLDAKNLWLDESFSLQRVEASWFDILRGLLVITDGVSDLPTIDQHPFAFFAAPRRHGAWRRCNEFALRFPSVMAATLLVPAAWALARRFVRYAVLPAYTSRWTALLSCPESILPLGTARRSECMPWSRCWPC